MKIISLFNNKGGVGKTTLAFHLSNILAEMGYKTLMIDLDPQSNLTINSMNEEHLVEIWKHEDEFIDDYNASKEKYIKNDSEGILLKSRTIHFLLKPIEDGLGLSTDTPPPVFLKDNLYLIPGRLTIHKYESKISERWNGVYSGDPLSIRTIVSIRTIAEQYAERYKYEFVIIDTSPSLGVLNKVVISTVDGFLIPASPDMFSLYGIMNIGNSLKQWYDDFNGIYDRLTGDKRRYFPGKFVRFLGYTIYNAKKYTGVTEWDLAKAHDNYAQRIPQIIEEYISEEVRRNLPRELANLPIGMKSVMHSHNTLPNMSQKYKRPIWEIPDLQNLDEGDRNTIIANHDIYESTKQQYKEFAKDFLRRIKYLG